MTAGEREVLADIAARVRELRDSLETATAMIAPVPADIAGYIALPWSALVVIAGYLKTVEQLEEQVARLFRTILVLNAVDVGGLFARDIADRMDALGIIDDAARWTELVKLRNRLVHDYPLGREARLARLHEVIAAVPYLDGTAAATLTYLQTTGLLP